MNIVNMLWPYGTASTALVFFPNHRPFVASYVSSYRHFYVPAKVILLFDVENKNVHRTKDD